MGARQIYRLDVPRVPQVIVVQRSTDARPVVVVAFMCDPKALKALFPRAVILLDQTPGPETWPQIMAQCEAAHPGGELGPMALLGWSAGCVHIRNLWASGARPEALGLFDGTHTSWPPRPEQDAAWAEMFHDGREAVRLVCVSHIFQTYVESIPVGQKGRASATVTTLRRVLGDPLLMRREPYTQQFGTLYVSSWPSKPVDAAAHSRQLNEALPEMCRQFLAPYLNGMRQAMLRADTIPDGDIPAWLDPALPYGERMVLWSRAEMAAGVVEVPPGSNTGPRIREYLAGCERNGAKLGLSAGAWCAAAAGMAAHEAALPTDTPLPWRAAGLDVIGDLQARDAWHPHPTDYVPKVGDLAIFRRVSPAWGRHVCRVTAWHGGGKFQTIGGNEAGAWRLTERDVADPLFLGFGGY